MRPAVRAAVRCGAFVLALFALDACYISFFVTTGPSPIGSIIIISDPTAVSAQPIIGAICPGSPPFLVQFRLVVRESGGADVEVREVRLRFVDRAGVTGPDMLLTADDLRRQFDSTRIPAHGSREFPFSPRFGCSGDHVGVFYVHVMIVDVHGAGETSELQVAVS